MKNPLYQVFVLGIGNILCTDDGAGVFVIRTLKQKHWPSEVLILEGGTSAVSFLEELGQSQNVIIVDAFCGNEEPGTVHRFCHEAFAAFKEVCPNSHDFSLPFLIELAKATTGYPIKVIVYGIEIKEYSFGIELSPQVLNAIPKAAEKIEQEILKICSEQTSFRKEG